MVKQQVIWPLEVSKNRPATHLPSQTGRWIICINFTPSRRWKIPKYQQITNLRRTSRLNWQPQYTPSSKLKQVLRSPRIRPNTKHILPLILNSTLKLRLNIFTVSTLETNLVTVWLLGVEDSRSTLKISYGLVVNFTSCFIPNTWLISL